jgi:hypothetical protein
VAIMEVSNQRTLREIAGEIEADWLIIDNQGARTALDCMKAMDAIEVPYFARDHKKSGEHFERARLIGLRPGTSGRASEKIAHDFVSEIRLRAAAALSPHHRRERKQCIKGMASQKLATSLMDKGFIREIRAKPDRQRLFRPGIAPQCSPFSARRWRLAGFWSKQQIHRSSPTADWRWNKYHAPRPCRHALSRVRPGPIVTPQLFCQVAASSRNHCFAWRGHLLAHPGADPGWT